LNDQAAKEARGVVFDQLLIAAAEFGGVAEPVLTVEVNSLVLRHAHQQAEGTALVEMLIDSLPRKPTALPTYVPRRELLCGVVGQEFESGIEQAVRRFEDRGRRGGHSCTPLQDATEDATAGRAVSVAVGARPFGCAS